MADCKKYNGSTWEHSLRKLTTATDTITTLPADIYADGNTATIGISGNTFQSGTPTPDNPIMPQGTGDKTGNLFDGLLIGGFFSSANFTTAGDEDVYKSIKVFLTAGTYIFSFGKNVNVVRLVIDGNYSQPAYNNISSFTFTSTAEGYVGISFRDTTSSSTAWDITTHIMLNTDSAALPYEPYGIKIPISSASTTTPVYLGEVETTRSVKKLVLTGEEGYTKNDTSNPGNYLYYQPGYLANKTCVCSHLADMGTLSASKVGVFNGNSVLYLNFGSAIMNAQPSGNTVAGLKEYLSAQYAAGTPVTIWYILAEPTTGIVNEPLMKIGDYADEVSGITIPTIAGGDTISVDTTVQPSEVSLNYEGWHDATVKEWDGSQWSE